MGSGFDEKLAKANQQLDRVSIRARGKKLSIRGTFPPKPGDGSKPKSYEISTGKPATATGLEQVRAIAQEIESQLIRDKFDWIPFLKGKDKPAETVGEWIERFEANHWSITPQTPTKLNSYHKDYRLKLNHLPPDEPLTEELLRRVIVERSKPGTRNRKGYAMAFGKLAEFAGIDHSFDKLGKGYSSLKPINPRDLPSDAEIRAVRGRIRNAAWQWVYDAIAIYGLRPHELFRLRTERLAKNPPLLEVEETTKTGWRLCYPMPADDWQEFDIQALKFPSIKTEGRNNNQLGMTISLGFREQAIGFPPYALRHCYARRCVEMGLPVYLAAKSMGHSAAVHETIYRAWIGEDTDQRIYEAIMGDRIKAFSGRVE
jgi:integrase